MAQTDVQEALGSKIEPDIGARPHKNMLGVQSQMTSDLKHHGASLWRAKQTFADAGTGL